MAPTIYKSAEGEARIQRLYDQYQNSLGVGFDECMVNTRFGETHVLMTGPAQGLPVVVTHGGNSIAPEALRGLIPLLTHGDYRVYAPDTLGHPGKSAQVRLSAGDNSYGQWLYDVMDGLSLDQAAVIGGSYGAGILLQLAIYAPQRISRMALFVPSGIVAVPPASMAFKIGLPYLFYLLFPSRRRMLGAIRWMGKITEEDELELIEAVFNHVRVEAEMPHTVTKAELKKLESPVMVIAAEKDALFPGEKVVKRAKEIFPNLTSVECLKAATHYSSKADTDYVCRRIIEFLESAQTEDTP